MTKTQRPQTMHRTFGQRITVPIGLGQFLRFGRAGAVRNFLTACRGPDSAEDQKDGHHARKGGPLHWFSRSANGWQGRHRTFQVNYRLNYLSAYQNLCLPASVKSTTSRPPRAWNVGRTPVWLASRRCGRSESTERALVNRRQMTPSLLESLVGEVLPLRSAQKDLMYESHFLGSWCLRSLSIIGRANSSVRSDRLLDCFAGLAGLAFRLVVLPAAQGDGRRDICSDD